MADRRRPIQWAAAHLLLQQDGDEAGHDDGGERERRQAAIACNDDRVHAVSISHEIVVLLRFGRRLQRTQPHVRKKSVKSEEKAKYFTLVGKAGVICINEWNHKVNLRSLKKRAIAQNDVSVLFLAND